MAIKVKWKVAQHKPHENTVSDPENWFWEKNGKGVYRPVFKFQNMVDEFHNTCDSAVEILTISKEVITVEPFDTIRKEGIIKWRTRGADWKMVPNSKPPSREKKARRLVNQLINGTSEMDISRWELSSVRKEVWKEVEKEKGKPHYDDLWHKVRLVLDLASESI